MPEDALLAFDCIRSHGPGYFNDVLVSVHTVGACVWLWSADHGESRGTTMVVPVVVPHSRTVWSSVGTGYVPQ